MEGRLKIALPEWYPRSRKRHVHVRAASAKEDGCTGTVERRGAPNGCRPGAAVAVARLSRRADGECADPGEARRGPRRSSM
jgi:hypothetical protein